MSPKYLLLAYKLPVLLHELKLVGHEFKGSVLSVGNIKFCAHIWLVLCVYMAFSGVSDSLFVISGCLFLYYRLCLYVQLKIWHT